jgi:DNA-directed RNA polymerase subunit M/transcription elongation factor TFIIS
MINYDGTIKTGSFCDCGSMMRKKKGSDLGLPDLSDEILNYCAPCDTAYALRDIDGGKDRKAKKSIVKTRKKTAKPIASEERGGGSITSDFHCPKCGNGEAYFDQQVTRGDEDVLTIKKCTKSGCDYVEREGYGY